MYHHVSFVVIIDIPCKELYPLSYFHHHTAQAQMHSLQQVLHPNSSGLLVWMLSNSFIMYKHRLVVY